MRDWQSPPEDVPRRSPVPVVIALVLGIVVGAVGWPLVRGFFAPGRGQRPEAESPFGEYSADMYVPGPEENGIVHMERRYTVRWHIDSGGWFTIRWIDHRTTPEIRGIRAGWWTGDPVEGPSTVRLDGETEDRRIVRGLAARDGSALNRPMPSIVMFPRFDPGLGTLTDEFTAVSRKLDLPARMPVQADEVDPTAAEPEVPATPR